MPPDERPGESAERLPRRGAGAHRHRAHLRLASDARREEENHGGRHDKLKDKFSEWVKMQ